MVQIGLRHTSGCLNDTFNKSHWIFIGVCNDTSEHFADNRNISLEWIHHSTDLARTKHLYHFQVDEAIIESGRHFDLYMTFYPMFGIFFCYYINDVLGLKCILAFLTGSKY